MGKGTYLGISTTLLILSATFALPQSDRPTLFLQTGHSAAIYSVTFSPDGKKLASGSRDNTVILWDLFSGKAEKILKGHNKPVTSIAFSPDGRKLASGSVDAKVILWDLFSGKAEKVLEGHTIFVTSVAFSPGEKRLASGSDDNTVIIWDLANGEAEKVLKGHTSSVTSVTFSHNGKKLASGSWDKTVIIWDLDSGRIEKVLKGHTDRVSSVAFSPDGKKLASGSEDNMVIIWDLHRRQAMVLRGHTNTVWSVAFSPDGKKLASGLSDKTVIIWDLDRWKAEKVLKGHESDVWSVAFSPDGKKLASGAWDLKVILWDLASGQAEKVLNGHTSVITSVVFSPDGKKLASGSVDNTVILWDLNNGRIERVLKGHTAIVWSVAFSPDGKKLASGSADGSVKVWDADTGRELVTLLSLDSRQDWLITTPEGYYDGSPNGARLVTWQLGNEIYPAERFEEQFKRPDLVARALRGEPLPADAPVLTTRKVPPMAQFLAPPDGSIVEGETVQVEVLGMDDEKVTDIELFVNGRPISPAIRRGIAVVGEKPTDEGRYKSVATFRLTVTLPPGEERVQIRAIVYDNERLKSNPAEVIVFRRLARGEVAQLEGDLYVLSIGVSRYKNLPKEEQLQFAHNDARAMAEFFKGQEGRLFRQVHVRLLVDEQATKEAIQSALFELIERVKRSDTVVLFFAGHGLRDEDFNYYFAPHELDLKDIKGTGVATVVFETALSKVDAKQIFAFFDTCHSGGVLGELRVGTERLTEGLMKKAGVTVFCSSTGEEVSFEREAWGHGAFTLALLEGLKGEADRLPQDGSVTIAELQVFVSSRVSELTEGRQNPRIPLQIGGNPNARLAMIK